ncbi:MAG: hypothetical protein WBQ02_14745, partial [Terracidiphilus sp.]
ATSTTTAFTVVEPTSSPTRSCCISFSPQSGSKPDSVSTTRAQIDGPISLYSERLPEVRPEDVQEHNINCRGKQQVHHRQAAVRYVSHGNAHHATCSVDIGTRVR